MSLQSWIVEQEEFLQNTVDKNQGLSWEQISLKISEGLNLPKRTAKQCEERYRELQINDGAMKIDWSQEEQRILIQKHRQIGNKWAAISQFLNGKNDNCVKNHFYSRLRKMIRKLNRIIQFYFKKTFRMIPNATIYKLVEASQERFKEKPICLFEVSIMCQNVISKMLRISIKQELKNQENIKAQQEDLLEYEELINEINRANKNYKKKSKKIKNSTIKAPVRKTKNIKSKRHQIAVEQNYKADQSQIQSEQMGVQQQKNSPHNYLQFKEDMLPQVNRSPARVAPQKQKKVQIKEGDEMQQLLKNIGLLHEGRKSKRANDNKSQIGNKSLRSYSDFDNPSEDNSFFEDSNNMWKKQSKMFSRINKKLFGDNSSQVEGQ